MANETKPRVIQVVDAEGPQLRITALVGKEPVHPAAFRQEQPAGLAVCQRKRQRIRNVLLRILRQKQLLNLCRKGFESVGLRRTGGDKQAKQKTEQDDPRAIFQVNPSIKAFLVKQRMRNGKYCRSSAKTAT